MSKQIFRGIFVEKFVWLAILFDKMLDQELFAVDGRMESGLFEANTSLSLSENNSGNIFVSF